MFQANWLDFTLTALIIILFVALCVTLCCYPSSTRSYRDVSVVRSYGSS